MDEVVVGLGEEQDLHAVLEDIAAFAAQFLPDAVQRGHPDGTAHHGHFLTGLVLHKLQVRVLAHVDGRDLRLYPEGRAVGSLLDPLLDRIAYLT